MKKRFLLIIILLTWIMSSVTFVLVLHYLDPYVYRKVAYIALILTWVLGISSLLCIFFYIFKKIYYRGRVGIVHVLASYRQWFLSSLFCGSLVVFRMLEAPFVILTITSLMLFLLIELFFHNFRDENSY